MAKAEKINKAFTNRTDSINALRIALLVGFFFVAILTAFLTYVTVRDFVSSWEITNLPGITVRDVAITPGAAEAAPVAGSEPLLEPEAGATPPVWDGAERVTMLLMGLDYRDWQAGEGPPRTDTMMLLTLDPTNRTAGILSIPRDLWVNIPGFEYGRINTAYQLGEAYKLPGGGPQLAVETVEELLGVPVDYYAQIDFSTFARFIDIIGGVEVDISEPIKLDPLADGNIKKIKPGHYNLPGDLALAYVRFRKSEGGDFDRSQRQQQVVMAIRQQVLNHKLLTKLAPKASEIYQELSSGIHTDLNLEQALQLAWLAVQIPQEDIKQGAINADHITFAKSPDGTQDVLKPRTEKIRELRDEIFALSGSFSPLAASMDQGELIKSEGARVAVMNASTVPGLAARTTDYLKSQGINVVQTGNAESASSTTEIIFHTGKPYTLKFLVDLMKISEFRIRHFFDPANPADIEIIVGDDWAVNNSMP